MTAEQGQYDYIASAGLSEMHPLWCRKFPLPEGLLPIAASEPTPESALIYAIVGIHEANSYPLMQ